MIYSVPKTSRLTNIFWSYSSLTLWLIIENLPLVLQSYRLRNSWLRILRKLHLVDVILIKLPNGLKAYVRLPKGEVSLVYEIFQKGIYDYFDVTSTSIVFDIGANIGIYTLKIAPQVRKVIAFEPEPSNFELLLNNIIFNRLISKVFPLNVAIGAEDKKIKLYLDEQGGSGTHSIILKRSNKYITVPCYKLDTIYKNIKREAYFDHVDLIKIDTEGAELLVLHGAQELLKAEHPKLIIATEHGITSFRDIRNFLEKKGLKYDFVVLNNVVFCEPK